MGVASCPKVNQRFRAWSPAGEFPTLRPCSVDDLFAGVSANKSSQFVIRGILWIDLDHVRPSGVVGVAGVIVFSVKGEMGEMFLIVKWGAIAWHGACYARARARVLVV
jgi:hypothetical protein